MIEMGAVDMAGGGVVVTCVPEHDPLLPRAKVSALRGNSDGVTSECQSCLE